jgi:Transglycosylase-like domain
LLVALIALVLTLPSGSTPVTAPVPPQRPPEPATLTALHRSRRAHHPRLTIPHLRDWVCIHSHEAPTWRIANPPYYGGLQMDIGFQRAYGGAYVRTEGTANRWTPAQQMLAAERAWKSRGFTPWPNTARMCGLL